MTDHGRDPRRAGEGTPAARQRYGSTPDGFVHGGSPRSNSMQGGNSTWGDFVLGADGKPLRDRYGRPVLKRSRSTGAQRPQQPAIDARRAAGQEHSRPAPAPHHETSQLPDPRDALALFQHVNAPNPRRAASTASARAPGPSQVPAVAQGAAGTHSHSSRRAKRAHPIRRAFGCAGVVVAAVLILTLAFVLWTDSKLTRVDALDYQQVANTSGTNWLLVGSDSRAGMTDAQQQELGTGGDVGGTRTDTIMLLHIPSSGKATLVSVPRDSYVDIPGFGMDKINAAFSYGGAPLLGETIEQWSGLRIDHYAEIGMGGLATVVSAVGGVNICVKDAINDPLAGIDVQAGCQNLTGRDALGYVRTRATAMGDLDRVQRQREFFAALLNKITSPSTLINPFRLVPLVEQMTQSFVVGSHDHVWNLARVALAMGSGVEPKTVPMSGFADTSAGNVMLWDDAQTAALWASLK